MAERREKRSSTPDQAKLVNVALQGGGAHGAFAWGVLDRLLEDGRISIHGISGTSAGAMNAVVLAHGLRNGGAEGGRAALEAFWRLVSDAGVFSPVQPLPLGPGFDRLSVDLSPAYVAFDMMTRLLSPYQFNPLNLNPLARILDRSVDFEALSACPRTHLYLSATNVRTGKIRVFKTAEVSCKAVMASACLPLMFQAVEIDGESYWDGGYVGNPAIFPLIYESPSRDVVIVHVNPLTRPDVPNTAPEILNRINEISFNSSLMREMRAIAFVTRLIDEGRFVDGQMKRMLIHSIAADDVMNTLSAASKLNTGWDFLTRLRDVGREHTAQWLEAGYDKVGREGTTDLDAYL